MAISGRYVNEFKYGNMACMIEVSMDGDYDFWYDIKKIEGKKVTYAHMDGDVVKEIKKDSNGTEYFMIEHIGVYERMCGGGNPSKIKCVPFLDDNNVHTFVPEKEPPKKDKQLKIPKSIEKMKDSRNWKSKCVECGGVMDYYNFKYRCRKCGNILEV